MVRSNSIIYETMFKSREELKEAVEKAKKEKEDGDRKHSASTISTSDIAKVLNYEEALELTGDGSYNVTLLLLLSVTMVALSLDMFGFSVVVSGCSCDFELDVMRKSILMSMPFAGAILMMFPWGYIADTQGRRRSLLISLGFSFIFTCLSSLSPNWLVLAVLKLIGSSFCCCIQSSSYTLLGESCTQRARGRYLLLMTSALMLGPAIFFSVSYYILRLEFSFDLGPLGDFVPWRLLIIVMSIPLGISWLGLWCFYESPKFLANESRIDEALKVLKGMWRRNGGDPQDYPVKHLIMPENVIRDREATLLKSLWLQTAPLFRPPFLKRTLQLFYITIVSCATHNSFQMWFPLMVDNFFKTVGGGVDNNSTGLCGLVTNLQGSGNTTNINDPENCTGDIEDNTAISGVVTSIFFALLNFGLSRASHRKKLLIIILFLTSAISCAASTLAPEPISALVFFILVTITTLVMGLGSSYFVELYPTSLRGMAGCLGVVVGRISAVAANNIVGHNIMEHCNVTFYAWSVFVLSGVVVAAFLPADTKKM